MRKKCIPNVNKTNPDHPSSFFIQNTLKLSATDDIIIILLNMSVKQCSFFKFMATNHCLLETN